MMNFTKFDRARANAHSKRTSLKRHLGTSALHRKSKVDDITADILKQAQERLTRKRGKNRTLDQLVEGN